MIKPFKVTIDIIGINPFVSVPEPVLNRIFDQAQKNKGPIPVCGTIDGFPFIQTLVKYSGHWRLYINGPMLKVANKNVGDTTMLTLTFDPADRKLTMHPKLKLALRKNNTALTKFESLPPYLQKELIRYINNLKTEVSIDKNVVLAIRFLLGKGRFIGRDQI